MKIKFLIPAMLISCIVFTANAQQQRTPEERAKMSVNRMSDSLGVDKTQIEKITPIMTDFYVSMQKLRAGAEPGSRPDFSEMQKLMKSRDEQLAKILTQAQLNKFKEMEERMRQERMKQRGQ